MTTAYETNPNRRCNICEGREVTTLEDDMPTHISLEEKDGILRCKDTKECKQNIEAENTNVEFSLDDKGEVGHYKISKFGDIQVEVDYDV